MNIYIDREKRITVAEMTNVQSDIFKCLCSWVRNRDINSYESVYAVDILRDMVRKSVPNILWAKAKCSPEDNVLEYVGDDLARARLLEKYYTHCLSILFKYQEYVNRHLNDRLMAATYMMDDKIEENDDTLLYILNSTGALN